MHRVEDVMGMPILVEVSDDDVDEQVFTDVFGWFRWVDGVFSTYKADSEISRINSGELEVADADQGVITVLGLCEQLRATTDGYFDARASSPELLDPSGLVKGWSGFDAFAYSFMSVNLVTLGMFYSLAVFAFVPDGSVRSREGRCDRGPRGGHVRRIRPRPARRRPAHAPPSERSAVGDDHRPRPRDR